MLTEKLKRAGSNRKNSMRILMKDAIKSDIEVVPEIGVEVEVLETEREDQEVL